MISFRDPLTTASTWIQRSVRVPTAHTSAPENAFGLTRRTLIPSTTPVLQQFIHQTTCLVLDLVPVLFTKTSYERSCSPQPGWCGRSGSSSG